MRRINKIEERLFNHYKRDEMGNYILDVSVPKIEDLFSIYDPSPLHQKDIEPEIMKMILSQIIVFPTHANVELHIHLPKRIKKKNFEGQIEQAIRHHFEYELIDNELHLQRRIQKGLRTFFYAGCIFATLFTVSYILKHFSPELVFAHLLAEGTAIGAWVSLWHPIEMLLYDWLPLYEEKKKFSRLLDIRIRFKYI